tara:strand:+ start:3469 stop:5886 length:2418 start_codon:yes stop_codon:yes gene_type:complete
MKINFLKYIFFILIFFLSLILYLSIVGIETQKFNQQIKEQVKKKNNNLDIDLKTIKLTLDLINFKINAKTIGSTVFYSKRPLPLEYVKTQISLATFFKDKIISSNFEIVTKSILLKDVMRFVRATNNSAQLFILEKIIENGNVILNINLNFDKNGKIKNDYEIKGSLQEGKVNFLNKNIISNINFKFNFAIDKYSFKEIKFTTKRINFISKKFDIKKKKNLFFLQGEVENNKSKLNPSLLKLLKLNTENIGYNDTNFVSKNKFSVEIDNKFNFKNLIINSDLIVDKLKYRGPKLFENYLSNVNKDILFKDHKLKLNYDKKKLSIIGNGKVGFNEKLDEIKYEIYKDQRKINFISDLDIKNLNIKKQDFLNNFFPLINEEIILENQKLNITYKNNKLIFKGKGNVKIENDLDKIDYLITKKDNKFNFDIDLNLDKTEFKIDALNYHKKNKTPSKIEIEGNVELNQNLNFNKINIFEKNNIIEINNLTIGKENLIIKIDNAKFDYLDTEKKKNIFSINKKNKNNYIIDGLIFNANSLITNLLIEKDEKEKKLFKHDVNLKLNIDKVYIDEIHEVKNLDGKIFLENNKVDNANIKAKFKDNENLSFTIYTDKEENVITTLTTSWAKPFVNRYKFIKGFEEGFLDFRSSKKNGKSNSLLIIDNFKVKEIPALAKLLALASLQGIADLLTGEGIRFTDFEMSFSNKNKLMKINELYAIGPSISILMEGYIQSDELISLRGTLVPASTINRTIASIPLIGDFLIGKKVGEGVFGVSFKIKGPPKKLETTVNPIKTLTPRFITRTLDKIKNN